MTEEEMEIKYHRNEWMTDDQWACALMLRDLHGGWHHILGEIKRHGQGISVTSLDSQWATFDFSKLTNAVILAHDRMIRLAIGSGGPGRVKLTLWQRHSREGSMAARHPTIEDAIEQHRKHYPLGD